MNAPDLLEQTRGLWEAGASLVGLILALAAGLFAHGQIFRLLLKWTRNTETRLDDLFVRRLKGPARLLIPLILALAVTPSLRFPPGLTALLRQLFGLTFIAVLAWLAVTAVVLGRDLVLSRYDMSVKDNLKARMMYTQIRVIERIVIAVILVIAVSSMLMTFEKIRQVGVSILASAGIIGVIAGFAAQKSIATLFAGIQIAITQPIRIDDVVIVEGEWGRIEEITLTYVVVRIWDLRRLIVPISYFIEKPFQNWTRVSADLLGTVFLYADYTVSVEAVREELRRILESKPDLWDGKAWGVQVTNADNRTVELRALMSAADSGSAWSLRCHVREKLLEYLQREYPDALPRVRAELKGVDSPAA